MVLLHPLHLVDLVLVQRLLCRTGGSVRACLAGLDGAGTGYGAPIHSEVGVCCDERSSGPVKLHGTSLCCPLAPVPNTAVDTHGLLVGEWLSVGFVVGEASDGYIVHKEAAITKVMNNNLPKKSIDCIPKYGPTDTRITTHDLIAKGKYISSFQGGPSPKV